MFRVVFSQAGTLNTKPTANIQGTTTLQGTLVKSAAGSSIVVKTPPGNVTGHFAAINKRMAAHTGSPATTLPTMVNKYFIVYLKFAF